MQSKYTPEQLNVKVFNELILDAPDKTDDEEGGGKFDSLKNASAKTKAEILNFINPALDFKRC